MGLMTHLGCGGEIQEDWSKTYEYEGVKVPSYRCTKCHEEILGDAQIMLEGFDDEISVPPEKDNP